MRWKNSGRRLLIPFHHRGCTRCPGCDVGCEFTQLDTTAISDPEPMLVAVEYVANRRVILCLAGEDVLHEFVRDTCQQVCRFLLDILFLI